MAEKIEGTIDALMKNLENFVSAKTIVGEPIQYKDIVVFPMADVSFGVAAGASDKDKKNSGAGGAGAKISPSAVLVIQNGTSKIVNIKDKDSVNKLIELIPDVISKLTSRKKDYEEEPYDEMVPYEETVTAEVLAGDPAIQINDTVIEHTVQTAEEIQEEQSEA